MNRNLLKLGFAALTVGVATSALAKPTISTPTITCGPSTQVGITIHVCAGASGLPAGFSIHWVKKAILDANFGIWPATDGVLACGASFSGNANLSRYNLAAGQCVDVSLGEFLFDEGASTNCPNALDCGTEYVFRAFGHATSSANRSDFTANLVCSTLACGPECFDTGTGTGNCTHTQGWYKTHGPVGCLAGNNTDYWSLIVDGQGGLLIGSRLYSSAELCSIFNKPASGNGLISLSHQLIAAKLNILLGADGSAAAACIASADALIGGLVVPPVGTGSLPSSATSLLTTCLTNYNEGATGPGHCTDCPPPPSLTGGGKGK